MILISSKSIRKMNQYDPEKSQIITKQNEEITHWHKQFRVWNTLYVKSAEKWMTGNRNNTIP